MACGPAREAIGVFHDEPSLGAALDDPLMSGFDRSDKSVLVGRRPGARKVGTATDHAAAWACGGLRLWVQTVDCDRETRAGQILKRQAAREVPVQEAGHTGRIFATA